MNSNRSKEMDRFYLGVATAASALSRCKRKQVGAVLVKDDNIISFGWNGTARGRPNECEDDTGQTKPDVVHAEQNAIYKLAATGGGAEGATLYLTMSPCPLCTAMIKQVGIIRVVYLEEYRIPDGIEILKRDGIEVEQFED